MNETFILCWIMIPVLYTLYRYYKHQVTLSQTVRKFEEQFPFLPWLITYVVGVLMGHWFFPM